MEHLLDDQKIHPNKNEVNKKLHAKKMYSPFLGYSNQFFLSGKQQKYWKSWIKFLKINLQKSLFCW